MKIRPLYDRVVVKRVENKEATMQGGSVYSRFGQRKAPRG